MKVTKVRIEDSETWITVKHNGEWFVIHIQGRIETVESPTENNLEIKLK